MNTLPKYWIVESDNSDLFINTVIKFLNENYRCSWGGKSFKYYGYDGNPDHRGSDCHDKIRYFINNPILLTIYEFIQCTQGASTFNQEIKNPLIIRVSKI